MQTAQSLNEIAGRSSGMKQLYKSSLHAGDVLTVHTANSVYVLFALEDGDFLVSGGWFDEHGDLPRTMSVKGCTWGGSVIKTDLVAARGLCIEFGNGVVTSPIQDFQLLNHKLKGRQFQEVMSHD